MSGEAIDSFCLESNDLAINLILQQPSYIIQRGKALALGNGIIRRCNNTGMWGSFVPRYDSTRTCYKFDPISMVRKGGQTRNGGKVAPRKLCVVLTGRASVQPTIWKWVRVLTYSRFETSHSKIAYFSHVYKHWCSFRL